MVTPSPKPVQESSRKGSAYAAGAAPASGAATVLPLAAGQRETGRGITIGLVGVALFFLAAWLYPVGWVNRYLLGHPVSVTSLILFSLVCGILVAKFRWVSADARLTRSLRDDDLAVAIPTNLPEADQWLMQADAGRVAKYWLLSLADLPTAARSSQLVQRLSELLQRQSRRASTRELPDEIRELAMRDSDRAHDSLQLNRIIVWSIPMLGFLGTVIGITQTLGGIDFSSGTSAIEDLKAGLYVAFDTTAVALVLSVVAIFLQFPVERAEQSLLAEIDRRVSGLLTDCLPADDRSENPASHIAELCEGLRVAVGQSLASQAELWRSTIDEAHHHWQRVAEDNSQRIAAALATSLTPLLETHGSQLAVTLQAHSQALETALETQVQRLAEIDTTIAATVADALQSQAASHTAAQQAAVTAASAATEAAAQAFQATERVAELAAGLAAAQTDIAAVQADLVTAQTDLVTAQTGIATAQADFVAAQAAERAQRQRDHERDAQRRDAEKRDAADLQAPLSDAMLALARAVDVLGQQLPAGSRHLVKSPLAEQVDTIPLTTRRAA